MLIGYVRVSTNDQNTDLQRNALNCAGCERIFEDKISGTKVRQTGAEKAAQDTIGRRHAGCLEAGQTGAQYAASCYADRRAAPAWREFPKPD
ncbi:site-specific DNA recombinase; e14 prophage [Escherichia coli]|nr:site-specific DNA recombinase; e14 prophage [Escherichia coli]